MTPVRPLAASVVALSIAGAFTPIPASAAPVPCEHAENYAAQSGAELLRLNRLDLRPLGRDENPVTRVGLAEAKSALIANGKVNSAAVSRMLDAGGAGDLGSPVIQQTPPTHATASTHGIHAGDAAPFAFGDGTLSSHARWSPGLACAAEDGKVTRAAATLATASILGDDKGALFTVRRKVSSLSTTALDGRGAAARAVASATIGADTIKLLGNTVQIKIKRAPELTASMATKGGEIRYVPAILEVSGRGIETARLDAAGEKVEITVDGESTTSDQRGDGARGRQSRDDSRIHQAGDSPGGPHDGENSEDLQDGDNSKDLQSSDSSHNPHSRNDLGDLQSSDSSDNPHGRDDLGGPEGSDGSGGRQGVDDSEDRQGGDRTGGHKGSGNSAGLQRSEAGGNSPGPHTLPNSPDERASSTESALAGLLGGLLAKSPVGGLTPASPLPLPVVSDLPPVGGEGESAQVAGPGTTLRISLGDVRQARSGHAVAARVSTIKITLTRVSPSDKTKNGYGDGAPDRSGVVMDLDVGALEAAAVAPEPATGGIHGVTAGAGGGLPITGPRVDYLAIAGVALLVLGAAATLIGKRRGRARP